mgnify:FL=1
MLNKELSLKECLDILNEMAKEFEECDGDSEGIYYLTVKGSERNKKLLNNLIPEEIDLGYYLYEYGNGDWIKYGIDLVAIWQVINYEFGTSIWFNSKKREFYIND